jgi:hypothetical protein
MLILGIDIVQKVELLEILHVFSIQERAAGFQKGIIDFKDIIFFISITILFLEMSTEILKKKS